MDILVQTPLNPIKFLLKVIPLNNDSKEPQTLDTVIPIFVDLISLARVSKFFLTLIEQYGMNFPEPLTVEGSLELWQDFHTACINREWKLFFENPLYLIEKLKFLEYLMFDQNIFNTFIDKISVKHVKSTKAVFQNTTFSVEMSYVKWLQMKTINNYNDLLSKISEIFNVPDASFVGKRINVEFGNNEPKMYLATVHSMIGVGLFHIHFDDGDKKDLQFIGRKYQII